LQLGEVPLKGCEIILTQSIYPPRRIHFFHLLLDSDRNINHSQQLLFRGKLENLRAEGKSYLPYSL
jgi:hypothetical protein